MLIRFFDWRDVKGGCAASTTNGEETTADCYNSEDPYNPWHWDVSIVKKREGLDDSEEVALMHKLAFLWMMMFTTKMPKIDNVQ
jgi:hypothetical protein